MGLGDGFERYPHLFQCCCEKILGYKVEEVVGFPTTKLWATFTTKDKLTLERSLNAGIEWKTFYKITKN